MPGDGPGQPSPGSSYWLSGFETRFTADADGEDVDHTIDWYRSLLRPIVGRPGRALDIGCGPARVMRALAGVSPTTQLVGIDGTPGIVDIARHELAVAGIDAQVDVVDVTDPGWSQGLLRRHEPFDLITCFYVLHHYPGPALVGALEQLRSLLVVGGRLVLVEANNPSDPRAAFADWICTELAEMAGETPDLLLDPAQVLAAVKQAGFEEVRMIPRRGRSFTPAERAVNRSRNAALRAQVEDAGRAFAAAGIAPPPVHERLRAAVAAMSRHRVAMPARIGPVVCVAHRPA